MVTLSTQNNAKLLQQLKSGFKRIIIWNKYLSKPELLARNRNLDQGIKFIQGINRLFVTMIHKEQAIRIVSSKCRYKRLQCYHR